MVTCMLHIVFVLQLNNATVPILDRADDIRDQVI